jgi:ubiquilin
MGPPTSPDEMLRRLEDPNFMQQMNEVMNNPTFVQMLEESPMFRDNPLARTMIRDPNMRRMMLDPNIIRAQLRMQQQMGGSGLGGDGNFPAPGVTDTTPQTGGGADTETPNQTNTNNNAPQNPSHAATYLPPGAEGLHGNPFAALFAGTPPASTSSTSDQRAASTAGGPNPNPNAADAMFGPGFQQMLLSAFANDVERAARGDPNTPFSNLPDGPANNPALAQNPALIHSLLASLTGGGGGGSPQPPDTRPPEERYEAQLRQLNDMGFFEFDRNIEALRRSGGSVQGAIEYLLSNTGGGS